MLKTDCPIEQKVYTTIFDQPIGEKTEKRGSAAFLCGRPQTWCEGGRTGCATQIAHQKSSASLFAAHGYMPEENDTTKALVLEWERALRVPGLQIPVMPPTHPNLGVEGGP